MKSGSNFSLKTGCLVVVVIAILIYASLTLVQCIQDSKGEPPNEKGAAYLITTASRIYLAQSGMVFDSAGSILINLSDVVKTYTLKPGESLIMSNWYDMNNGSLIRGIVQN